MSRWPFLLKHLPYSPVNPLDSFHTWRESTDPTFSNSLAYFTITSFFPVRREMNGKVRYLIHWLGIYYLWWDVELTYWQEVTL